MFGIKKNKVAKIGRKDNKVLIKINAREEELKNLTKEDITKKSLELKESITEQVKNLDDSNRKKYVEAIEGILKDNIIEVFALGKRAVYEVTGKNLYDVQIIGGLNLNEGNVSEMKTGEGKTLTSVLPIYLNALTGKGVHVLTTNSYLSRRDAEELRPIFTLLGISVGINREQESEEYKKEAFSKDVTYSLHSELAFDYLRDNMKVMQEDKVIQRGLSVAIVDECDSILIDEARTPLVISGQSEGDIEDYKRVHQAVKSLTKEDYEVDIKTQQVFLAGDGDLKLEQLLGLEGGLYETENLRYFNLVQQSLKANYVIRKGVDYLVRKGEVKLLDSNTGRVMQGKQYSDGLHQAIEAKEKVNISPETKTTAKITYQNFFRLYNKLCGMTGTAKTEEEEFIEVYNMKVVQIPTNKPTIREDLDDIIFITKEEKLNEITRMVQELNKDNIPVLIGTKSVDDSEVVSRRLSKSKIKHNVLNAKNHENESAIIEQSGQPGMVTVATNMAGRGTDIKLGEGVREMGGLVVIGTDKHESRRIDNQLRGRSGRQGDPGTSVYVLSLEDELVKRFVPDSIFERLKSLRVEEGQRLQAKFISKSVESAQKRLEGNNFDTRKEVLKYDNILDKHRRMIYETRDRLMTEKESDVKGFVSNFVEDNFSYDEDENLVIDKSIEYLKDVKDLDLKSNNLEEEIYNKLVRIYGENRLNDAFRFKMIYNLDRRWTDHLELMEGLLTGLNLKSYAQEDPFRWYQNASLDLYNAMVIEVEKDMMEELITEREDMIKYKY